MLDLVYTEEAVVRETCCTFTQCLCPICMTVCFRAHSTVKVAWLCQTDYSDEEVESLHTSATPTEYANYTHVSPSSRRAKAYPLRAHLNRFPLVHTCAKSSPFRGKFTFWHWLCFLDCQITVKSHSLKRFESSWHIWCVITVVSLRFNFPPWDLDSNSLLFCIEANFLVWNVSEQFDESPLWLLNWNNNLF